MHMQKQFYTPIRRVYRALDLQRIILCLKDINDKHFAIIIVKLRMIVQKLHISLYNAHFSLCKTCLH